MVSKDWCYQKDVKIEPEEPIDDIDAGIYSAGAGNKNIPNSSTGVLFCFRKLALDYSVQIFIDATKAYICVRFKYKSYDLNWQDWRTLIG